MKICIIGKAPPIQGGTSKNCILFAYALASAGNEVHFITNAQEVEPEWRILTYEYFKEKHPEIVDYGIHSNLHIYSTSMDVRTSHIPSSQAYVTKLSSLATDVVRTKHCSIIVGDYFEPYCLAAHLAARWCNIPYVVRHAGSDIERLINMPQLATAYREMLSCSTAIMTSRIHFSKYLDRGIELNKLFLRKVDSNFLCYNNATNPLDINCFINFVRKLNNPYIRDRFSQFTKKEIDYSIPILGVYGKIGESKGHFDLIHALGKLKKEGRNFNLVGLMQGPEKNFQKLRLAIKEAEIQDSVWLLPYIPPWAIPTFIQSCTAVCYLERDFSVECHFPFVPMEVMSLGKCLLLSKQMVEKQPNTMKLIDLENILLADPKDQTELTQKLNLIFQGTIDSKKIGNNALSMVKPFLENKQTLIEKINTEFSQVIRLAENIIGINHKLKINIPAFSEKPLNYQDMVHKNLKTSISKRSKESYSYIMLHMIELIFPKTFRLLDEYFKPLINKFIDSIFPRVIAHKELINLLKDFLEAIPTPEVFKETLHYEALHFIHVIAQPVSIKNIPIIGLGDIIKVPDSVVLQIFNYNIEKVFMTKNILQAIYEPNYRAFVPRKLVYQTLNVLTLSPSAFRLLALFKEQKTGEEAFKEYSEQEEICKEEFIYRLQNAANYGIIDTCL